MSKELDTSKWVPRKAEKNEIGEAFQTRCSGIEKLIIAKAELEQKMNLDNFDSGAGVEEIIRDELGNLLPKRYLVSKGVLSDRNGFTAGDVDVIIFNEQWFPYVKAGASGQSRRFFFPIEGVYAIGEIKQTLSLKTLEEAMQKLVVCHRLNRPKTNKGRIVENRTSSECIHGLTNPLYSFIIAVNLESNVSFEQIVDRFFDINKSLKRLEVIRSICVLQQGSVMWGFLDHDKNEVRSALFMLEDIYEPIFPIMNMADKRESSLYHLLSNLMTHLYHSILGAEDVALAYGKYDNNIMIPSSMQFSLAADEEWIELLKHPCKEDAPNSQPKSKKS
jgi:hypothetical protein